MTMQNVYVGLGGNLGDVPVTFAAALLLIKDVQEMKDLVVSHFYKTSPVSSIPQPDYLNAVCRFKTVLDVQTVFAHLQRIQKELGQTFKPQDAPRHLDLDLLLYGNERFSNAVLQVPHPRWRERLFVLMPLADVANEICIGEEKIDLQKELRRFKNNNHETVQKI